jgi:hypothetical protein
MSTIAAKTYGKAATKAKSGSINAVEQQDDVIVQKTYRMAATMTKYPLPGK